jgi:hypothetical protein
MRLTDALDQLDAIHDHLAKAERYRGYRPLPVGLAGCGGILAALLQPAFVAGGEPAEFLRYWLLTGLVCGLIAGGPTLFHALRTPDEVVRRNTRRVVAQFLPCLLAGGLIAVGVLHAGLETGPAVALLPGLWAIVFALGVWSSRPYLPPGIAWITAWYLSAGLLLLLASGPALSLSGWAVGGTFGIGQLLTALVLLGRDRPGEV